MNGTSTMLSKRFLHLIAFALLLSWVPFTAAADTRCATVNTDEILKNYKKVTLMEHVDPHGSSRERLVGIPILYKRLTFCKHGTSKPLYGISRQLSGIPKGCKTVTLSNSESL